jgi:hypothetical protein
LICPFDSTARVWEVRGLGADRLESFEGADPLSFQIWVLGTTREVLEGFFDSRGVCSRSSEARRASEQLATSLEDPLASLLGFS